MGAWQLTRGHYVYHGFNDQKQLLLHRWLLNVTDPAVQVDHKNGNPLDNRRENLRPATRAQNNMNARKRAGSTSSRYKGVSWYRPGSKWRACIQVDHKQVSLGYYDDEISAAEAYNSAALSLFGEFARVNEFN